ncbi:DEAD/DEAH box helicase [Parabacteroides sp. W1-Q-101]|uniref:DEAD/DEAH box helicase n=1 Tax=Parabacteroides TaxID=375288 RepID=UPI00202E09C8|nr:MULTISPECIES: DEAD/DEAH box helicase [Parabacteroides]MCM0721745.1 DEAD/DEAH box helicase [Parabacteroides sp. W1-Q-101]
MKKQASKGNDVDEKQKKVSYYRKPEGMTLEEWQIALRKQFAMKSIFLIEPFDSSLPWNGDFQVINPQSNQKYKVAFRGENSEWNYCSCPDFKTNQLGTCKHIEAVKLKLGQSAKGKKWLKEEHIPPYTSVYLSYKGKREVKIRIGSNHQNEFVLLAGQYFTNERVLKPETYIRFERFLQQAAAIDDTFRCYDDALAFVISCREKQMRTALLDQRFSDGHLDGLLKTKLFPYQEKGILFAARAGRSLIADEMGLGKTIQAIGTAELLKKQCGISSVLIICPTSLKYQWESEIKKFTDSTVHVIEGHYLKRREQYRGNEFYKIVSYNSVANDLKVLKHIHSDMVVLDEAQRIKNWKTQIAIAVKRIESDYLTVLTGTPLENKLEELYSIVQYIDPFCLGPYYKFLNDYQVTDPETGKVIGFKGLNHIGQLLSDSLIRRRKKEVLLQLPERMDKILTVPVTKEQMAMHDDFRYSVNRLVSKWRRQGFLNENDRKRLLLNLGQMRMVADSSYILDQSTRYDTKVDELMNILRELVGNGNEKAVVFSQWERMTRLVAQELDKAGIPYKNLHGGIPSEKRKELILGFNEDPSIRVFLSTDAGSTGLNLQSASLIVNLDIPWNPAVLEQRIARIHRLGQQKNVSVINFVSAGTIEERMLSTLRFKSGMSEGVLDDGIDSIFLEDSKFNRLMETIENVTGEQGTTVPSIQMDEIEQPVSFPMESDPQAVDTETFEPQNEISIPRSSTVEPSAPDDLPADRLIRSGIDFFNGLASTLSSPEKTERLVASLLEEDKQTGETHLKIPVKDKDSVMQIFNFFGKLLNSSKG